MRLNERLGSSRGRLETTDELPRSRRRPFYDVLVWYWGEPLAKVAVRSADSIDECRPIATAAAREPRVTYAEIRYHRNSATIPDGDVVSPVERF
jgi:hypothetical protein